MASRDSINAKRGNELPHAKVTPEIVRQIRRLHERKLRIINRLNRLYSLEALGKRYGISKHAAHRIATYENWRHVL